MTSAAKNYITLPNRWMGIRPWTRHSLVLLVAGLAYVCIGIAYHYIIPGGPRWEALVVARHWIPLDAWATVFVIVGIMSIISSRWPPFADSWGYAVLTGLSSGWGAFYFAGVIFENTPMSNLTAGFVWWLVAFMWWAISGLINPDRAVIVNGQT